MEKNSIPCAYAYDYVNEQAHNRCNALVTYLVLQTFLVFRYLSVVRFLSRSSIRRGTWGFAVLRCWCFFNAVMR